MFLEMGKDEKSKRRTAQTAEKHSRTKALSATNCGAQSLGVVLGWEGMLLWLETKEFPQVLEQKRMIIP